MADEWEGEDGQWDESWGPGPDMQMPPWNQEGFDHYATGYDDMGEEWEPPTVYVESSDRKEVESFAKKLEELGVPEDCEAPEYMPYCRMDASALLSRLAQGREGMLKQLEDAIVDKDWETFVSKLGNNYIGQRELLAQIRTAAEAGDRETFAEGLRILADPELERLMEKADQQKQNARELANTADPLMGNERRCKCTYYLGHETLPDGKRSDAPIPVMKDRPDQEAVAYMAIGLGHDADTWEEECQYHPYVWDCWNAGSDLMMESRGVGFLDGRSIGERGMGKGIFG